MTLLLHNKVNNILNTQKIMIYTYAIVEPIKAGSIALKLECI